MYRLYETFYIKNFMTDIERSLKIFLLNIVFRIFKIQSSNGDFKSLISICSFIKMHHAMFFEGCRMSLIIGICDICVWFLHSDLSSKKSKMALTVVDKIKVKKIINENQNLKTSKLIKHVLKFEIGPQTLWRLKKTSLEDLHLGSDFR